MKYKFTTRNQRAFFAARVEGDESIRMYMTDRHGNEWKMPESSFDDLREGLLEGRDLQELLCDVTGHEWIEDNE